jgi:hypothetical protein
MGFHEFIECVDSLLPSRAVRAAQRWSLALCIAAGCLLSSGGAAAFLIDHFHHGPFTVTDYGDTGSSGTGGLQTGLPPDEVMGGSRREWITMEYPLESESATAQLDGGGDVALSLTNKYARGYYQFDWDVSEPVDLTHGGVADSFRVNITGFPNWRFPTGVNPVDVEVYVESPGSRYGRIINLRAYSPGMMELPFSAMTYSGFCCADLTQIIGVTLLIDFANVLSGAVRVSSIATGPEPPPAPDCSDAVDNDGDGFTDHPDDPGCADAADDSEKDDTGTHACDDGSDNDGDNLVDYPADPGCFGPGSGAEDCACQDGDDNEGDGTIDFDGGLSALGYVKAAPDPQCTYGWQDAEKYCGLGAELALLLPPLLWLYRRQRRRRVHSWHGATVPTSQPS